MFVIMPSSYTGFEASNSSSHSYIVSVLPDEPSPYPNVDVLIMS